MGGRTQAVDLRRSLVGDVIRCLVGGLGSAFDLGVGQVGTVAATGVATACRGSFHSWFL
jgi:hypothetical protein